VKVKSCPLEGLKLIELDIYRDERGFFTERFNAKRFEEHGLPRLFFNQINHSRSVPGVIRGLHFQHTPAQGKMVGVSSGKVLDVVVDVSSSSKTFGQSFTAELDDSTLLWIPAGFAHGFSVLGDEPADLMYFVDAPYNPAGEQGIRYNDRV
jgi:dTDP-4-dehydrorhamnose 3,5-epimerase